MTKISAVICELNPFHKGHEYIFDKAKNGSDVLIAVMSGNFVQRGENAVYDKYKRASDAVHGGADLVLELPFPFSASSAEFFASAAVKIAESVGATDLYFGSECGDVDAITKSAGILNNSGMGTGRAAVLRSEIIMDAFPDVPESILSSPNDILGVEYCRKTKLNVHPVKRIESESASDIRKRLYISDVKAISSDRLLQMEFLHFRSIRKAPECAECNGGVGGRLYNTAFLTNNPHEWMSLAATKQYTNSRLRRAALFSLLCIMPNDIRCDVGFTRVLAANSLGREYLASVRGRTSMPVISNPSDRYGLSGISHEQYSTADFADKLYTLLGNFDDSAFFAKKHSEMI